MVWKGTRAIFNRLMADLDGRTMPKKRRRAPEVHTIDCDVELSQFLSHELASAISQDICKHILFMRNQIPRLYDELAVDTKVNHDACPAMLYLGLHGASVCRVYHT